MGKTVKLFITILIFSISLLGGDLKKEIDRNLQKIPFSSKKELIQANNNLKNLYIKAIIAEDEKLQKKALKGIIQSSKILHFPYERYKEAYDKLSEIEKLPKAYAKIVKKEKKKTKNNTTSRIRNIRIKNGKIEILLNKTLDDKEIKIFNLNKKNLYRKIIDIQTNLPFKAPSLKLKNIKKIKIAQNKKNLVRIVIENRKPIKINYAIRGETLILNISESTTPSPKKAKDKRSSFQTSSYKKFSDTPYYPKNKVIVIDPGHGGKDSGAIGYQQKQEKIAILQIAKKLKKELEKRGFRVYLTRETDTFIELRERTKFANKKMADIFISIHANAAPNKKSYLSMKGIETYFLSPAKSERAKNAAALENKSDMKEMDYFSKEIFLNFYNREKIIASNKLAIDIQAGILKNLRKKYKRVVDGGVREGPFWVLVGAQMPAILIETGYITNPTDAKRLFNPFFQKVLAKGIADGIESYFLKNR